jgi:hypothetical protein
MNDPHEELQKALEHYARDQDTCSGCGKNIQFVEACSTCDAPDGDCFDFHTFGSCAVCLGCDEPRKERRLDESDHCAPDES